MKQRVHYSQGTGAILIIFSLAIFVCFFDTSQLLSLYRTHVQPTFGKTHFIVGQSNQKQQHTVSAHHQQKSLHCKKILFAPDDDIQQELINLINQEQESIKIAIFTFTDNEVAQALINAHERGVVVEIVTDAAYLRDQYSKIALLQSHKIPIYTYNPHYKNIEKKKQELLSIMHNKFAIFMKNYDGKSLVWTGSFNFTRSAKLRNQENVVILDEMHAVNKFMQQFVRLKHRCDDCSSALDVVT